MSKEPRIWYYRGGRYNYVTYAKFKKEAIEAFNITRSEAENFMDEGSRHFQPAVDAPGSVWRQSNAKYNEPWEQVVRGQPWRLVE